MLKTRLKGLEMVFTSQLIGGGPRWLSPPLNDDEAIIMESQQPIFTRSASL